MRKIFVFYLVVCISAAILLAGCTDGLSDGTNQTWQESTDAPPANESPMDGFPVDGSPADVPTDGDGSPADGVPIDDFPANDSSADDYSTDDSHTNDSYTDDSPTDDSSVESEMIIELSIDSCDAEGVNFTAPETGEYTLTFTGGASSHLPETDVNWPKYGGWWTRIIIYINKPIEWGEGDNTEIYGLVPVNYDHLLGSDDKYPTYEEAETAGQGLNLTIDLNKNDYIIVLEHDHSDYYFDNSGILKIEINYTGSS